MAKNVRLSIRGGDIEAKCENCMYYSKLTERSGKCRLLPPNERGFPVVESTDWCGKFIAKRTDIRKEE